jgi:hypothetical protein
MNWVLIRFNVGGYAYEVIGPFATAKALDEYAKKAKLRYYHAFEMVAPNA